MTAMCPLTEIEMNAMADADAVRLDHYATAPAAVKNPTLYLMALRAAAHLRKMRQQRVRQLAVWQT